MLLAKLRISILKAFGRRSLFEFGEHVACRVAYWPWRRPRFLHNHMILLSVIYKETPDA